VRHFWLRRPFLILRGLLTRRDRPNLERLARIEDPETFAWAILPHAARTFSACIAMLPARSAMPAAVAYLYCRMLDTYEDLVPGGEARDASLSAFAERLTAATSGALQPAPPIEHALIHDDRDRAHLLLVQRAHLIDALFLRLDESTRAVVHDLVHDMAEGMRWSSRTFDAQRGVLCGESQLAQYCRHVLGNPVVFGVRLVRLAHGAPPQLSPDEREEAMRVGELVQLANVTRDVEKDLRRGIAYDDALRDYLGRDASNGDRELAERCRQVRERLLRMALSRAPAYGRIIESMQLRGWSVARASGVLMLLFTERYFRSCAARVGMPSWTGPRSTLAILWRTFRTSFSERATVREIGRVERAFLHAASAT
jgi:phytoene/squalene synthetase